jgi:hypothetical protein
LRAFETRFVPAEDVARCDLGGKGDAGGEVDAEEMIGVAGFVDAFEGISRR